MASSMDPPALLKTKLTQVECLLNGASKRLEEEAKKCKIFATKASASGSSSLQNSGDQNVPRELERTLSDITTLKSVLSCPIFNRIVNVTDSLDKLSYQLNLHPSIGPTDIDIDANGELILTPPIEPAALNNLVNSRLEELVENSLGNPLEFMSSDIVQTNISMLQAQQNQITSQLTQQNSVNNLNGSSEIKYSNGFSQVKHIEPTNNNHDSSQNNNGQAKQNYIKLQNTIASSNIYDNQRVINNDNQKMNINNTNVVRHDDLKMNTDLGVEKSSRIYKFDDNFMLDQVMSNNNLNTKNGFQNTQPMNQISEQMNDTRRNGNSNGTYKSTHGLNKQNDITTDQHQTQMNGQQFNYSRNVATGHNQTNNVSKVQALQSTGFAYNRGSCSPSTSAGSTVRLADECDSGASSYQSQSAKATSYSPFTYKLTDNEANSSIQHNSRENRVDSMEQDLIENLSPELEQIEVTLEKVDNSLGITIAGYTCDKEEISGIFIKEITPNSPADRSGKIRTLDQIFAVNGRELLSHSNTDAVNVLRKTGKVVTLQLMRFLDESKYRIVETALANAELNTSSLRASINDKVSVSQKNCEQNSPNVITSPTKSSIPISRSRDVSQTPTILPTSKSMLEEVPNIQQVREKQPVEAIYKNEDISHSRTSASSAKKHSHTANLTPDAQCNIPVAAQRGGTNKVIETKQGARNTIDIRSPVCQTNTVTYVNKITELEFCNSNKSETTVRVQRELSDDEFRRLVTSEDSLPEWEKDAQIIELHKDKDQGLGFTVKEYANPKDQKQSIIMITSLTPSGIAEKDGRLSFGDLLIFVDDTDLEGASLAETVKALKKTDGQVRLGVLKLKRS